VWIALPEYWAYLLAAFDILISLSVSAHVVLHKRDTRAAIVWVGIVWLSPILGALLYFGLGINRIQRRARSLRSEQLRPDPPGERISCPAELLDETLGLTGSHLRPLKKLVDGAARLPLTHGNRVELLVNGERAFPAMLEAINGAERSITLSTYIFDNDRAGQQFLDALTLAVNRGVQVRVIIDDVGARYTWPSMPRLLRRAGIPCANFLPTLVPWRLHYSNLRNHRKILVIDGRFGFTGGMNIREGNYLEQRPRYPVQDLHLRLQGPIVTHLQEVFAEDWAFCTGELLEDAPWFAEPTLEGPVLARGLPDGPDEDAESFHLALLGAIAGARGSIMIVTPYFLPDPALVTALEVAAMSGTEVDIVLPSENNLILVQWASNAFLGPLLERGCRIWFSPPPFDHAKIFVVDGLLAYLGSSNWDPRSLRLNFEFNVECYDTELAQLLTGLVQDRIARSRELTCEDMENRSLPVRLREGIVRLASPYL
jgi:cardiolipin synthase